MEIKSFDIDDSYLVRTSGTSDGTQDKYYKDGLWFKLDRYGGEGIAETAASIILEEAGLPACNFVKYEPCLINGKRGCFSHNFLKETESFITLYRLYKNVRGRDLAEVTSKMDYDDAIEYVLHFVKEQTNLDLHEYLANTFALDRIILNEDRHFNNLGIIYNEVEFKIAPIFDNGKSFFIGNKRVIEVQTLNEKLKHSFSKCFSPSFDINANYLEKFRTINFSKNCIEKIESLGDSNIAEIVKARL